ncbi:hypothetical protein HDU93_004969 [Gonapodya sp. JEL0774]|nr:hypothetical protein HDU93_004969 [Gonapodya sp. JEL0774]
MVLAFGVSSATLLTAPKTLDDNRCADLIKKRLEVDYETTVAVVSSRGRGAEDLRAQVEQLTTEMEQLTTRLFADTDRLKQELAQSASQTSSRATRLEQQIASLQGHQPSSHAQTTPVDVKRLMHVVANFTPSDPDEIGAIALAVG